MLRSLFAFPSRQKWSFFQLSASEKAGRRDEIFGVSRDCNSIPSKWRAGAVAAQDLEDWDYIDGWDFLVDPTLGAGYLIRAAYQDVSVVPVGFAWIEGGRYMTAFNNDWGDIVEDEY